MAEPEKMERQSGATRAVCQVKMHNDSVCGRPLIYGSGPGCLMHSEHSKKDAAGFQREIESILKSAGEGIADFTRFVFPELNFANRNCVSHCVFHHATFTEVTDFSGSTFERDTDFSEAVFTKEAYFIKTQLQQVANFRQVVFNQDAWFNQAVFVKVANFFLAKFSQAANFGEGAKFGERADFSGATFTQDASFTTTFNGDAVFLMSKFRQSAIFYGTEFGRNSDFRQSTFGDKADFSAATFTLDADFRETVFKKETQFWESTFNQGADFSEATFVGKAEFSRATFSALADFCSAQFLSETEFRKTVFRDGDGKTAADFSLARFGKPETVVFYKTKLGQVLFHTCDVSKVVFSSVEWRKRPGNQKRMVFEEVVTFGDGAAEALKPIPRTSDERNYVLIAELYQQLKKNYDDRRDYWTAGDFHYGEMEMKRLSSPHRNKILRWLHRKLGMVAWYKYASEYGESYVRPLFWLVATLLLFMFLFPVAGLNPGERLIHNPAPQAAAAPTNPLHLPDLSYWNFSGFAKAHPRRIRALFGNSFMTALYVVAFQREFVYEPSYPCGRLLALIETLLTSTLFALFLLALRRQFRR
jgi:pentapeptide repeat protein